MSESDNSIEIVPDFGVWRAQHDAEVFGGPTEIALDGDSLIQDCTFYLDDFTDKHAVVKKQRLSHKAGTAVVNSEGYFPFGKELKFRQVCRYAANHVRCTFDFNWSRDAEVKRHLGIGTLFLPGEWERFFVVPPLSHLLEGQTPAWHQVPAAEEKAIMVGHWHRPPLSVVFQRSDGKAVEIGTGSDIWRWEKSLGYGPESGSYKIFREPDGIRFVREPLMCCEVHKPPVRQYRFSWYAAWRGTEAAEMCDVNDCRELRFNSSNDLILDRIQPDSAANQCFSIDFNQWKLDENLLRLLPPEKKSDGFCWQANAVQKQARRVIRQLASISNSGRLLLNGVTPGICSAPLHLGKTGPERLSHWDINGLLDFATWTRQQLGPDWSIVAPQHSFWQNLPILNGLFSHNGFRSPL